MISDGQVIKQIRRLNGIQSIRLRKKFAQPSFLFMEGANMGRMRMTHPIDAAARQRYMLSNCSKCMDYTHRGAIGQGMAEMDYTPGIWDFNTCHETCWHDRRSKSNDIMREYYWRKKAGLVKNQRRGKR